MKSVFVCICFAFVTVTYAQTSFYTPWIGRSTGKLPALAYGLGEDRLGGAKLGYIDSNIALRVMDTIKGMYLVQLSRFHQAFIEQQYVRPDSINKLKPWYVTGSMSAKGDSATDNIGIIMEEKLPYKSWMEVNPSKIVVDVYGVQSNTNWITQLQTLKEVKNVYYQQVEDDVFRVTIELKHQQHWGYSIGYIGRSLVVKVRRQPQKTDLRNLRIAIDAGHGGTNTGASGIKAKASEKLYTLRFAKALQKHLKLKGVKNIIMTRTEDTTFDNKDRILWLQEQQPDLLISLHLNSSANTSVSGTSTYYKHIGFRPLTTAVLKRMLELKLNEFGNIGSFNFALNSPTDFPNVLVEIAFLSNEADEKKIISPKFHADVATKIHLGLVDWLKALK
ncbi:MAG TPA: N-acetylmuramoyl-L-alanine amidase [Chitinophagaceae bacterium]|jgi:N-acetylmuramoyl-L-alanine amidase|nr:N-acetylmuramoyl-L-alanine amidase [Chitinophagaceae bacterium]